MAGVVGVKLPDGLFHCCDGINRVANPLVVPYLAQKRWRIEFHAALQEPINVVDVTARQADYEGSDFLCQQFCRLKSGNDRGFETYGVSHPSRAHRGGPSYNLFS